MDDVLDTVKAVSQKKILGFLNYYLQLKRLFVISNLVILTKKHSRW